MLQELLYQERSIAEIGRINPDLWDFGRLPSLLLYCLRFRGFPPLVRYCSPFPLRATQPTSEGARSFGAVYFE